MYRGLKFNYCFLRKHASLLRLEFLLLYFPMDLYLLLKLKSPIAAVHFFRFH